MNYLPKYVWMYVCLHVSMYTDRQVNNLKDEDMEPVHIHAFWTKIKEDKRLAQLSQKVLKVKDLKSSDLLSNSRWSLSLQGFNSYALISLTLPQ